MATEKQFKQQLTDLTSEITSKSAELLSKQKDFAENTRNCEDLAVQLKESKLSHDELEMVWKQRQCEFERTLVDLDKQLAVETSTLNETKLKTNVLTRTNAVLQQKIKETENEVKKRIQQRDALRIENQQIGEQFNSLTNNLQKLQETHADLVTEVEINAKINDELQKEIQEAENEIKDIHTDILRDLLNASPISDGYLDPANDSDTEATDSMVNDFFFAFKREILRIIVWVFYSLLLVKMLQHQSIKFFSR